MSSNNKGLARATPEPGPDWFPKRLREYIDEARESMLKLEGRLEAFEATAKLLNPEEICQICGYQYQNWRSAEDKLAHAATHAEKPPVPSKC